MQMFKTFFEILLHLNVLSLIYYYGMQVCVLALVKNQVNSLDSTQYLNVFIDEGVSITTSLKKVRLNNTTLRYISIYIPH